MKRITFFLTLFPALLFAQKDSVKVTYSQEEVANFEKPTFIDEYEKAFGGNRIVRSSLKIGLGSPNTSPLMALSNFYNIETKDQFNYFVAFEKKISKAFTLNLSADFLISNVGNRYFPVNTDYSLNLEGRWYYQMKKRIIDGKQADNLNGNYVGLKISQFNFQSRENLYTNLIPKQTFLITLGKQFGANVDISIYAGLQYAREGYVKDSLLFNDQNGPNRLSFVMGTYTKLGLGLIFPQNNFLTNSDKCEFMRCNYAVNHLFKFDINDIIYVDKFRQQLNLNLGFEQKIAQSAFSINSNVGLSLQRNSQFQSFFNPNKIIYLDTIGSFQKGAYLYNNKFDTETTFNLFASIQLRYYLFMKRQMITKHVANNLSGTYLGISQDFQYYNHNYSLFHNFFTVGHQQQVSHNFYIDYGLGIDSHAFSSIGNRLGLRYFIKIGFAK